MRISAAILATVVELGFASTAVESGFLGVEEDPFSQIPETMEAWEVVDAADYVTKEELELAGFGHCQGYQVGKRGPLPLGEKKGGNCDLSPVALSAEKVVRVYFVRHAESTWNQYTKAIWPKLKTEILGWAPSELTDAQLSWEGIAGATGLRDWLRQCAGDEDQCFLGGHSGADRKAVFATSNLRRAILTGLIAFSDRIAGNAAHPVGRIHTLSSLQEITANIDSTPITPPGHVPSLNFGQFSCPFQKDAMKNLFDPKCHLGNNQVSGKTEEVLIEEFCNWAAVQDATDLVLVGHSIWIRQLFAHRMGQSAAPSETDRALASKLSKLSNQGIVKFDIRFDQRGKCSIEPGTSKLVHGELQARFN